LTPFVTLLAGITSVNTNFVGDLRTFSSNKLPNLMMVFNNIRKEEDIEVLVFVEKQAEGPSKVVCANLPFDCNPLTLVTDYKDFGDSAIPTQDSTN
jgi:hypothetical protein